MRNQNKSETTFSQSINEIQSQQIDRIDPHINEKISYILESCPEKILTATKYSIKNPNLLLLILLYEDISKIYNEYPIPRPVNVERMKEIKEEFLVLAFIGDCALELGILKNIWEVTVGSGNIPSNEYLNDQKKLFVKNEQLAEIWDSLGLYNDDILLKNKDESSDLRGSRMEAVFGIIYLESGLEAVEKAIHHLNYNN